MVVLADFCFHFVPHHFYAAPAILAACTQTHILSRSSLFCVGPGSRYLSSQASMLKSHSVVQVSGPTRASPDAEISKTGPWHSTSVLTCIFYKSDNVRAFHPALLSAWSNT